MQEDRCDGSADWIILLRKLFKSTISDNGPDFSSPGSTETVHAEQGQGVEHLLHPTIQNLVEHFMMEVFSEIPNLLPDSFNHHYLVFNCVKAHDMHAAAMSINNHLTSIETFTLPTTERMESKFRKAHC